MRLILIALMIAPLASCSMLGETTEMIGQMQVELTKSMDLSKRAYAAAQDESLTVQQQAAQLAAAEAQLGVVLNKTAQLGAAMKSDAARAKRTMDGVVAGASGLFGLGIPATSGGLTGIGMVLLSLWRDWRKKRGKDPIQKKAAADDLARRLAEADRMTSSA